jgi:hypothetical protein
LLVAPLSAGRFTGFLPRNAPKLEIMEILSSFFSKKIEKLLRIFGLHCRKSKNSAYIKVGGEEKHIRWIYGKRNTTAATRHGGKVKGS